jgi:ATP-dependent Clp protease ATP-binding subunit ClpB
LKRVIQHRLENPIASAILRGQYTEGDVIRVDVDPAKHDFTFTKGAKVVEGELVEH